MMRKFLGRWQQKRWWKIENFLLLFNIISLMMMRLRWSKTRKFKSTSHSVLSPEETIFGASEGISMRIWGSNGWKIFPSTKSTQIRKENFKISYLTRVGTQNFFKFCSISFHNFLWTDLKILEKRLINILHNLLWRFYRLFERFPCHFKAFMVKWRKKILEKSFPFSIFSFMSLHSSWHQPTKTRKRKSLKIDISTFFIAAARCHMRQSFFERNIKIRK